MKLDAALDAAGMREGRERLAPHWDDSMTAWPEGGPDWLEPARLDELAAFGGFPEEARAALRDAAGRVAENDALARLAWHCHRLLFDWKDYGGDVNRWPEPVKVLGAGSGLFYVLLGVSGIGRLRRLHAAMGVPEGVTRDSCVQPWCVTERHRQRRGRWGIEMRGLNFFRQHCRGEMFRVGRFQYIHKPFRAPLRAWRHVETGEVVALAADGEMFDPEGYKNPGGDVTDAVGTWRARLVERGDAVEGTPLSPTGHAERRTVRLDRAKWRLALAPGDPVLEMHINPGESMKVEACGESMRQAAEFFPRFFPERPFVALVCASWLFNTQLEDWLGDDSNLVRYMRELYLYPTPSTGRDTFYFVFGVEGDLDLAAAPRNTRLERAIVEHLEAGGRLRSGGMFFLAADLTRYGAQRYRSQWPPRALES